tara:strand:- start:144 stop:533 length:390 start_codon:yes stop_codon:yes gene_type:complete
MYFSDLITEISNNLYSFIKDYDVSKLIAEKYILIRQKQSIKDTTDFYLDRLDYPSHFIVRDHIFFKNVIKYMASTNGGMRHSMKWKIIGASFGIPNLNKQKITIQDKANDLAIIKNHMIKSHGFINTEW